MKEAAVIRIGLVVLAGCSADGRRDASVLVPVHFVGGLAAERGDEATPRARPRGARVAAVATVGTWWVREDEEAASYTCALLEDGRVKCWGRQHDVGAEAVGDQPGEMGGALRVVDLGADENGLGRRATHLAVGRGHACVVLTTGNVHCWGDNDLSQLGYQPVSRFEEQPTALHPPISMGSRRRAVALSVGDLFSCAILDSGSLKCWGANERHQWRDGGRPTRRRRRAVSPRRSIA